jgi:hypothetical protein
MNNLKRLGAAVILTLALGLTTVGGEILTPPCSAPEPGEILTPPCGSASGDLGTAASAPAARSEMGVPAVTKETSFSRIAADVLLSFLPLL